MPVDDFPPLAEAHQMPESAQLPEQEEELVLEALGRGVQEGVPVPALPNARTLPVLSPTGAG